MTNYEIKAKLYNSNKSMREVALELGINFMTLSQTINYIRRNSGVRAKLRAKYGVVFNDDTPCVPAAERQLRKAA